MGTHAVSARRKSHAGRAAGTPAFSKVPFGQIKAYVDEIVERFGPKKVILFGSYAYGRPTADSDVDLLVIMPFTGSPPYQAAKIRTAVRAPFAMDLIVRTPQQVRERMGMRDYFMHEIMEKGRVLHER